MALDADGFELGALPVAHGYSPRSGGVSADPFRALNLGASVGDDPDAVNENRRRVASSFGVAPDRVARLHQVHGAEVHVAGRHRGPGAGRHRGPGAEVRQGDALIGDDPTWLLAVSAADCLPVILVDVRRGAVGVAHAGWRGTVAGVVPATVRALARRFGSDPADLVAWLGPAIQGPCYQVGPEVVEAVGELPDVPASVVWPDPDVEDRFRLDVPAVVRAQLLALGLPAAAVSVSATCTHCAVDRCFSHRRDRGRTGRHWAVVRPPG